MSVKGYKVFNPDWTCRGFQYEVGQTYTYDGNIDMCRFGFHFCQRASDCFGYYEFNSNNKVAEVEAVGLVEAEGDKSVTDKLIIVREIKWSELLTIVNEGTDCTGFCNTGNCNTGNYNTGNHNTGNHNTGNYNTGNHNTGNYNTGNCNTGNYNIGDCNTGNWNSTNFSTGLFNSVEQPVYIFNKPTKKSYEEVLQSKGILILNWKYKNNWWIYSDNMSDDEKENHPEYKITGGYLKTVDFKTACKMMWKTLSNKEKQSVMEIPNFDASVFEEITGIDVNATE